MRRGAIALLLALTLGLALLVTAAYGARARNSEGAAHRTPKGVKAETLGQSNALDPIGRARGGERTAPVADAAAAGAQLGAARPGGPPAVPSQGKAPVTLIAAATWARDRRASWAPRSAQLGISCHCVARHAASGRGPGSVAGSAQTAGVPDTFRNPFPFTRHTPFALLTAPLLLQMRPPSSLQQGLLLHPGRITQRVRLADQARVPQAGHGAAPRQEPRQ